MRPKLKETPREWRKFISVWSAALTVLTVLLWKKAVLDLFTVILLSGLTALVLILGMIWPGLFRPVYRVVMIASFHVGQVMGKVLLSVFFILFLTPFALLLRLFGMDLLRLRKNRNAATYWQTPRPPGPLDRMF